MSLAFALMFLALLTGIVAFGGLATGVTAKVAAVVFVLLLAGMVAAAVGRVVHRNQTY